MFDEFQEIEWRARIEAIRETLDQQRDQRQEQERNERADREAGEAEQSESEQEIEQAGVFALQKKRMTTTLQWHGDRLLPGEHCESHLIEFRNVIELDDSGLIGIQTTMRMLH